MKNLTYKLREYISSKFIVFGVAMLSFMLVTNCEKSDILSIDKDRDDNIEMFDEYGKQHNEILGLYFKNNGERLETFDDRMAAVDAYYTEIDENYKAGFALQALEEFPNAEEALRYIGSREFSHEGAKRLVNMALEREEISKDVYAYMNDALKIYSGELGLQEMVDSVKRLTDRIVQDKALGEEDQENMLKIMSIANYSLAFLQQQYGQNPDPDSAAGLSIPPWAERDLCGAFTAVASGSASWGLAVGGPWGAAGVMVGYAAVSSAFR